MEYGMRVNTWIDRYIYREKELRNRSLREWMKFIQSKL